jgi:hypothetical protein
VITDDPRAIPVTTPVVSPIVATLVLPLFQVPPPASLSAIVAPIHTAEGPVMAAGNGLTVTVVVTAQPEGGM